MRSEVDVSLAPVSLADLREVETIFDELTAYSQHVDGVLRRDNAAYEFVTALPVVTPCHKHAFLARCQGLTVGLLDIVDGYPVPGTAFIGLLAVRESAQKSGVGRALFREAERLARDDLRARNLRLAVVETNPVMGFWMKMGFRPTGEVKPFEGEVLKSSAALMEKEL
ncbi:MULTISPECIES: GNAT family N-acetyltransferase [unclassified Bradyrhizobium]|uniref:GNAT family N-acetyltransferase n=1 Tax=unclassified Bradyrhizobium TaxID=2631580 RepID=UPI0028ED9628|nr:MULTISPECIES: GNAT family N-acetyltransferase [unclassified Bradyrhizobium]